MCFRNYRLWITWSDHSVKTFVLEHALTDNMWKCRKNLQTLHERTFFMCFHHLEWSSLEKCLPDYSLKSSGCFLTHWLSMTSMLLKTVIICNSQCKCNYLKNAKPFIHFLFYFRNLHQILKILKKKIMIIANESPKLRTVKNFVRSFCQKRRFGTPPYSQHVTVFQVLAKSPWERFYHAFSSFWEKLIWKMSSRLFLEILGVFLNKLTADGKYPVEEWENLRLPMQMQLSEKRKTFSQLFAPFLESTSNFKHFEKRDDGHS